MNDPNAQAQPAQGQPVVSFDAWCNSCGYNLLGLPLNGNCPECAKPVDQSLRGDLLENCEPAHIATLLKGVTFVLNGILAMVLMAFVGIGIAFAAGAAAGGAPNTGVMMGLSFVNVLLTAVILYGWWQFSTLDPAYTGRNDASQSRSWIRNLLIASIPVTILGMFSGFFGPPLSGINIAISVVGTAIWVARFFFEMSYIRWLAPRIPNPKVAKRAKLMLWLGPVLYTFGLLLLGLGPLVALVLYWNLLHWIRLDLKKIQAARAI